jgi:betaine-aldehyde dehydrogenase
MTATLEPTDRQMLIDGASVEAQAGSRFDLNSPAHDVKVSSYPDGDANDVDRAVNAARAAFDHGPWPKLAAVERARALHRVSDLILRDLESLARTETLEGGKPISQARDEVASTADLWAYAATLARHSYGDAHSGLGEDMLAMVLREPLGVVGMIMPWNFPLLIVSQKLPFALAVGCTAVIKPSGLTPGTTVMLAELCREAGIPDGVVNVVTGRGSVGAALAEHRGVNMVSFTGSTAVGTSVAATAASQLKRVELELGGKNPQIVFPDADMDAALDAVVFGVYFNQGECCNSGSRLLVHKDIAAEFSDAVIRRAKDVIVGDPLEDATKVGAIVSDSQLSTIERYVSEGNASGAELRLGGSQRDNGVGRFFEPTVFTGVTSGMSIANEEIFGPVLSVLTFSDFDDAVRLANSTIYGLSAGIWTSDVDTALRGARELKAGTVWVNSWMDGYAELPFGGVGQSGVGRELGRQAIEAFTETKTIQLHIGARTSWWLPRKAGS